MKGTLKWFNTQKGYGFITGEDGKDYFVHSTELPPNDKLNDGDAVLFDPKQAERGPQAMEVAKDLMER